MTKITATKLGRKYTAGVSDPKVVKREKVIAPNKRELVELEYLGHRFSIWMSDGQVINKRKAWKRYERNKLKK